MRISIRVITVVVCAITIAACGSGTGSDSLSSHGPRSVDKVSQCIQCHTSDKSPSLDPLVSNGTGSSGKHVKHVTERSLDCEVCHYDYINSPTHMNGTFDTANPSVTPVNFNSAVPNGLWINDTGPQTGSCSSVSCHGTEIMDWYGTTPWSTPATCTSCHTGSLDPITTNGTDTSGKHVVHVGDKVIDCAVCHLNYTTQITHMNSILDTGDPAVTLVNIEVSGQAGTWADDTGPQTGSCSSVVCHGADTLYWYGTASWSPPACTVCHVGSLDPVLINGEGTSGKHVKHVSTLNLACDKCHADFPDNANHMSGQLDTADPSASLVIFDATNLSGAWINDTGPQTGSCTSLNCHGSDTLDWYGTAGWSTPSCSVCHSSAFGTRRQVTGPGGDFDKESHHVISYSTRTTEIVTESDCLVCHDQGDHMTGVIRLKDKDNAGQVVLYDPANSASLEPFCLSCHDVDGATTEAVPLNPFSGPNTLGTIPNSAGTTINASWNKTYGHKTSGLTCMGTGSPNTGCHGSAGQINAHGSTNYGLLTNTMKFSIGAQDAYNEADYQLCYSCHSSYPGVAKEDILGVKLGGNFDVDLIITPPLGPALNFGRPPYYTFGINTRFIDSDAHFHGSTPVHNYPLHWFHLSMFVHDNSGAQSADAWLYRGQGTSAACATACHSSQPTTGRKATCTACHSVHGSNTSFGMLYDEFIMTHDVGDTTGSMGMDRDDLLIEPIFCGVSECHSGNPSSNNYLFDPINE